MKTLIRYVTLFLFCSVGALPVVVLAADVKPVAYSLHGVTLVDLSRAIIVDVMQSDLIIDSEVLKDQEKVSFVVKNKTSQEVFNQLSELIRLRGFSLDRVGGVYHFRKPVEVDDDVFVYQPRYRSVSYLVDLLSGVLGRDSISTQRVVRNVDRDASRSMPNTDREKPGSALSLVDKSDKDVLLIRAKPKDVQLAKKLLVDVDKPVGELLVKAVLMEVKVGETEGSAMNVLLSILGKGVGVSLTSEAVGDGALVDKRNAVRLTIDKLDFLWSAISTDKRFKVVSSPQLRVMSGSSARFAVGAEVPILGAVNYQGNGQSVQSVQYKPSGVILDLRPEIRGDVAELKINQQLSSFARTETGVNNSPTLLKRELSTSVMVGARDVVLLGGLDEEKSTADDVGLFFLPRFMRSNSFEKSRTEIVLMLHVERVDGRSAI